MIRNEKFDDLRPYYDEEINAAMCRIAENESFPALAHYVYPEKKMEEVKTILQDITTIQEFQLKIMIPAIDKILKYSVSKFSYEGLEYLTPQNSYVFMSNHRDIMLDAAFLQYIFVENNFPTTEITFGSNLMHPQLVVDIGKSNKMFKVERANNSRDFYKYSLHLSEYIRYTILEKKASIWIAQRNGRTKDGLDLTSPGIIKMLCMSNMKDAIQSLTELNIVPVSISYQWEPCDFLKAKELCVLQKQGTYTKQSGEDLNSILTGLMQPKGDVHIHFGKPLTAVDLHPYSKCLPNDINKKVAQLIDEQIIKNYHLDANNYIALDLLRKDNAYTEYYSDDSKTQFLQHYQKLLDLNMADRDLISNIFLHIYANPVHAKLKIQHNV